MKTDLELINDTLERLASFSDRARFCKTKQDLDIYIKFIKKELKVLENIEENIINLK